MYINREVAGFHQAEHQVGYHLLLIRPIKVDPNGGAAAVFDGNLCGSNGADGNAELTGGHGNGEVGEQTNEQLDEGQGEEFVGGPDNIGEARKLRIPNDPGRPTRREAEEHTPFHWP